MGGCDSCEVGLFFYRWEHSRVRIYPILRYVLPWEICCSMVRSDTMCVILAFQVSVSLCHVVSLGISYLQ